MLRRVGFAICAIVCCSAVLFIGLCVPSVESFASRPITLTISGPGTAEITRVRYASFLTVDSAEAAAANYTRVSDSFTAAIEGGRGRFQVAAKGINVSSPFGRVLNARPYKWLVVRVERSAEQPVAKVISLVDSTGALVSEVSIALFSEAKDQSSQ
jgi:hypothetical protein